MAGAEELFTKSLHEIAAKQRLENYDITIKPFSSGGANFLSVNYQGTISSQDHDDINVFAKVAAIPGALRQQIPVQILYALESSVYTKLAPVYETIQEKYYVPEEDRFKFAKFYLSSLEPNKEIIVLEDLVASGYAMYDRLKPVTWEYASKVVEELAKFHALSLAFKKDFAAQYEEVAQTKRFHEMIESMYNAMKEPFEKMTKSTMSVVPSDMRERLVKFIEQQWEKEAFVKQYSATKWGFLIHTDFRPSNILFKRKGGKVKYVIPIDYQGVHVGSPSMDLMYFIYAGTDAEFRKFYLDQLLDHYYETLSQYLKIYKINPETTFSRQEFDDNFRSMYGFGLGVAMSLLPTVLVDPKEAPNLESQGMSGFAVKLNERFIKRILPMLNEFVELGVL